MKRVYCYYCGLSGFESFRVWFSYYCHGRSASAKLVRQWVSRSFDGMMAWLYLMWLGVSLMIVLSFKKQRSRENALTQMLDAYNLDRDPVTRPFGQYASRMAYMESISFWASPYRWFFISYGYVLWLRPISAAGTMLGLASAAGNRFRVRMAGSPFWLDLFFRSVASEVPTRGGVRERGQGGKRERGKGGGGVWGGTPQFPHHVALAPKRVIYLYHVCI